MPPLRGDKFKNAVMEDVEGKLSDVTSLRNDLRQILDENQALILCHYINEFLCVIY